jgi:hypothetical protein
LKLDLDCSTLLGFNFSVAVWIGYIARFGIAVGTGVVMVVYLHEALNRRLATGAPLKHEDIEAALIEGAVQRLRTKRMTVCVVLASLGPILWETGVGADVMKPIAAPIVGGMITSTIPVLILVPVFFALMKERALRAGTLTIKTGVEWNRSAVCEDGIRVNHMIRHDHQQMTERYKRHNMSDIRARHDRHAGHSVAMFRDKFWLSLALTIPVVFWSTDIQHWLGYTAPTFPGSNFIPPILGTVVFVYGCLVFVRGAWGELAYHQPGMMTLISLGTLAALGISAPGTFGLFDIDVWWELRSLITVMLVGHWLELRAISQARGALNAVAALLPSTAKRLKGAVTKAVGIVVSESPVPVRLFCHGQLVGEIIPQVWMMDHAAHLHGTVKREQVGELTILTPNLRPTSIAE